ncbi:MAG: 50S ribosomal protein L9 [Planctomycetota bacterium]
MVKPPKRETKQSVVLLENFQKVGRRGEVVRVTRGYARNYLIPFGKAMEVTNDNLYRIEFEKKRWFQQEVKIKEELQELAKKIKKTSIRLEMNANEAGHLFGSVNENMISEAFLAKGLNVNPKTIDLAEVKKELGVYEIQIKLHPEVIATTKIHVVAPKSEGEVSATRTEN